MTEVSGGGATLLRATENTPQQQPPQPRKESEEDALGSLERFASSKTYPKDARDLLDRLVSRPADFVISSDVDRPLSLLTSLAKDPNACDQLGLPRVLSALESVLGLLPTPAAKLEVAARHDVVRTLRETNNRPAAAMSPQERAAAQQARGTAARIVAMLSDAPPEAQGSAQGATQGRKRTSPGAGPAAAPPAPRTKRLRSSSEGLSFMDALDAPPQRTLSATTAGASATAATTGSSGSPRNVTVAAVGAGSGAGGAGHHAMPSAIEPLPVVQFGFESRQASGSGGGGAGHARSSMPALTAEDVRRQKQRERAASGRAPQPLAPEPFIPAPQPSRGELLAALIAPVASSPSPPVCVDSTPLVPLSSSPMEPTLDPSPPLMVDCTVPGAKKKRQKRVSWASELANVREYYKDPAEKQFDTPAMNVEQELASMSSCFLGSASDGRKREVEMEHQMMLHRKLEREETWLRRAVSEMPASIQGPWPVLVLVDGSGECVASRGAESAQRDIVRKINNEKLGEIYLTPDKIPPSPKEPAAAQNQTSSAPACVVVHWRGNPVPQPAPVPAPVPPRLDSESLQRLKAMIGRGGGPPTAVASQVQMQHPTTFRPQVPVSNPYAAPQGPYYAAPAQPQQEPYGMNPYAAPGYAQGYLQPQQQQAPYAQGYGAQQQAQQQQMQYAQGYPQQQPLSPTGYPPQAYAQQQQQQRPYYAAPQRQQQQPQQMTAWGQPQPPPQDQQQAFARRW